MVDASLMTSCLGAMSGIFLACALGIPVPEEITLLSAGIMVAAKKFPLYLVAIPGFAGMVVCDTTLFILGRRLGRRIFRFPLLRSALTEQRVQWAESHIHRDGSLTCFIGRFIPGLRVVVITTSGALGIKPRVFLTVDILAVLIIVSLWIAVGYWMGSSFVDAAQYARDIKVYLIIIASLLLVLNGSWRFIKRKRINLSHN